MKKYLVEIRFKPYVKIKQPQEAIVCYVELHATNEIEARFRAYGQFMSTASTTKEYADKLKNHNATLMDLWCPDALQIE